MENQNASAPLESVNGDKKCIEDFASLDELIAYIGRHLRFNAKSGESIKGETGEKGDPFVFDDLTAEQVKLLKGEKGEDGEPLKFADLTDAQKLELKGDKGEVSPPPEFSCDTVQLTDGIVYRDIKVDDGCNCWVKLVYTPVNDPNIVDIDGASTAYLTAQVDLGNGYVRQFLGGAINSDYSLKICCWKQPEVEEADETDA